MVFDPALRPIRRVLCFGAHPDDLDFGASGTVAAWTAAGVHVEYCIMTDGDAGGFDDRTAEEITETAPRRTACRGAPWWACTPCTSWASATASWNPPTR